MASIFNEENSIVLEAARRMVSLGSEAAQLSILGKQSKTQDEKINKILKLLTAYRRKDDMSTDDLESILYDLRGLTDTDIFPTISPIVGQSLVYLVNNETGSTTLQIQNNSSNLPNRSILNFYTLLQAVDDGTGINVGLIPGTDGYVLTMDSGIAQWMPASGGGHDIFNGVDVSALTTRDNLRFSNGLTASDNDPDTDVKLGGNLVDATTTIDINEKILQFIGSGVSQFFVNMEGSFNVLTGDVSTITSSTSVDLRMYDDSSYITFNPSTLDLYASTNITLDAAQIDIDGATINLGVTNANALYIGGTALESIIVSNKYGAYYPFFVEGDPLYFKGIEYDNDYSANYSIRSLIDKGYADATYAPIAGSFWSLASGGTLTGNNTITMGANTITFTGNRVSFTPDATVAGINVGTIASNPSSTIVGDLWYRTSDGTYWGRHGGGTDVVAFAGNVATNQIPYSTGSGSGRLAGSTQLTFQTSLSVGLQVANIVGITQQAQAASWAKALTVTPGAHTSMTAATEFVSNDFAGASQQWLAGTVATQRFNYFRGFTVTGASATNTITNAYTLYVDSPVAGTNAAITNNFSAGFAGNVAFYDAAGANLNYLQVVGATFRIRGASTTVIYSGANTLATFSARNLTIGQASASSGWTGALTITPGLFSSITASTELVGNDFQGNTWEWLAGTVATQRFNYFRGFTVTGASATATFTNAYTLYVDPPVAGTNATITNNWAAGFAGNVQLVNASSLYVGTTGNSIVQIFGTAGTLLSQSWQWYSNNTTMELIISRGATAIGLRVGASTAQSLNTADYTGMQIGGNLSATFSSGSGTTIWSQVKPTHNYTGTYTGTVIGYDYNPTITSLTGATHYAFRSTSGGVLLAGGLTTADAGATITASTKLDVRGISSGNIFVGKSNGGTQRFVLTDGGSLIHNETAVFGNTAVDADSTVTINQNKSLNGIRIDGAALTSSAPSGVYDIATWTTTTASSDTYYKLYLSGTINATNGAHRFNGVFVNPTFTALSSDAIGFGYQPTVTSVLGNNIALWADNGGLTFNGKTSPSQITSNQNDYNPTGLHHNLHIRLNSDASRDITGIVAGINGEMLVLHNIGSFNIVLKDESGSSSAANRLALNADITLLPDQSIWLWYDSTSTRWRAINA